MTIPGGLPKFRLMAGHIVKRLSSSVKCFLKVFDSFLHDRIAMFCLIYRSHEFSIRYSSYSFIYDPS